MSGIFSPFSEGELIPKPERIEVAHKRGNFSIGIPKEMEFQEKRICLTPDAVGVLTSNGHEVTIETGAGLGAHFTDNQYSEAGAMIAYDRKDVFSKPLVLKVEPPTTEEIELMSVNAYLLSAMQLNTIKRIQIEKLAEKKITALGFEKIRDDHNQLSIVRLIGEIAGINTILVASELLSVSNGGNGLLMGGVAGLRPTEVVIIGAGTVGESAARAAIGLGCNVRIFDNSLTRLRRLQSLMNYRLSTSVIDPKELKKSLRRCDVAIGALRGNLRSPAVVSDDMVQSMKSGSVIIDVSIDTGGCFETSELTTHEKPTFIKHGVIHYGVSNITSRVSRTTSKALSNFFLSYFLKFAEEGGFENMFSQNRGMRAGVYMYKGKVTSRQVAQWFEMPFNDINLFMF